MRNWIRLAAVACAVGLVGPASADEHKDKDKALTDSKFVDKVVSGNMAEIALGRIAHARSQNDEVRRFAARMVEDHSKAYQDLILIVSEQRIAIPEKPLPEQEKHVIRFHRGEVKNFDQEYMKHMVESHGKTVELLTKGSKELKNEKLKAFAEKTLPTVKEHLKLAREVQAKIGRGESGSRTTDTTGTTRREREPGAKSLSDTEFVTKAASSGMAEVAIGKLGQKKAKNADVKKFADRIVTDHTKANQELTRLAKEAGITVPDKPARDQTEKVKHFEDHASDFDREFVKHMVDSHTKGVDMFTKASKELKNEQLRSFAEKTLPTLKEHLSIAKRLHEQVGRGD